MSELKARTKVQPLTEATAETTESMDEPCEEEELQWFEGADRWRLTDPLVAIGEKTTDAADDEPIHVGTLVTHETDTAVPSTEDGIQQSDESCADTPVTAISTRQGTPRVSSRTAQAVPPDQLTLLQLPLVTVSTKAMPPAALAWDSRGISETEHAVSHLQRPVSCTCTQDRLYAGSAEHGARHLTCSSSTGITLRRRHSLPLNSSVSSQQVKVGNMDSDGT